MVYNVQATRHKKQKNNKNIPCRHLTVPVKKEKENNDIPDWKTEFRKAS